MKRALSVLLSLMIIIGALPVTGIAAFADDGECNGEHTYGAASSYYLDYEQGDETSVPCVMGNYACTVCGEVNASKAPNSGPAGFNAAFYVVPDKVPAQINFIGTGTVLAMDPESDRLDTAEVAADLSGYSPVCVNIGNGITEIQNAVFLNQTALESVYIPKSLTALDLNAFTGCSALSDIYYASTEEDWNNITISSSNTYFENATIHYNSADCIEHSYTSSVTREPSWTENGITTYTCSNCGDSYTETTYLTKSCGCEGDNATFTFDAETGLLTISGEYFILYSFGGGETTPDTTIKKVVIGEGISGSWSDINFDYSTALEEVVLPSTFKYLPRRMFYNCTALTKVTLAERLTEIRGSAFAFCSSLSEIELPEGLTELGENAFYGCTQLGEIVIPSNVSKISNGTFGDCTSLTSVTIPASVTSIEPYAFDGCTALTDVYYASDEDDWNLITIDNTENKNDCLLNANIHFNAGGECDHTYVATVTKQPSWTENGITTYTCSKCGDSYEESLCLTGDCFNLTANFSFDANNGFLSVYSTGWPLNNGTTCDTFANNTYIKGLNLDINSIYYGNAFNGCTELSEVYIEEGLIDTNIGTFANCSALKKVTLPESLEKIGRWAFSGCSALETIIVPAGVTSIDEGAFNDCTSLSKIAILNKDCNIYDVEDPGDLIDEAIPTTATIYGLSGSTAQTFAQKYAMNFRLTDERGTFGDCGEGVTWDYDIENATLTISGNGSMTDYYWDNEEGDEVPWQRFSEDMRTLVIESGVNHVGEKAFMFCTGLTDVSLAEGVGSIGREAFRGCTGITEIAFPSTLSEIHSDAFSNTHLSSITVSSGNECYDCRNDCNALIETDSNRLVLGCKNTVIPDSVTAIGRWAFEGNLAITDITIPASIKEIPESTFYGCEALKSVTFNEGLTEIGENAFCDCASLENVTFPETLTSIGYAAFSGCKSFTEITVPKGVNSISNNAFASTDANRIQVSEENTVYDSRNNCNAIIETETNTLIAGSNSTVIPSGVTNIASEAFADCTSLNGIDIPESVTFIGDSAFWGCTSLAEIDIPDSVNTIEYSAFSECSSLVSVKLSESLTVINEGMFREDTQLREIVIPEGVTEISDSAFWECSALSSITVPVSVTHIGWAAFLGCSALKDVYYASTEENWSKITINEENECLVNAKIHCTDSKPYNGRCGDVFWKYDSESATLTIYGNGAASGYPWVDFAGEIKYLVVEEGVTSIGASMLADCTSLASVLLPETLEAIGATAFKNCKALRSVTVPESVTSLGDGAFEGCTALVSVNYSGKAETWKEMTDGQSGSALDNCAVICSDEQLVDEKSFTIQNNAVYTADKSVLIKVIEDKDADIYTVPETVTEITEGAFENLNSDILILSEAITKLGPNLFGTNPEKLPFVIIEYYDFIEIMDNTFYTGEEEENGGSSTPSQTGELKIGKLHAKVNPSNTQQTDTGTGSRITYVCKYNTNPKSNYMRHVRNRERTLAVESPSAQTYTGSPVTPDIRVFDARINNTVAKGSAYNLDFADNKNIGKATFTVTGINSYSTQKDKSVARFIGSFKINPKKARSSDVVLGKTSYTYTGKTITPSIKVFGSSSYSSYCKISGMGSSIGKHTVTLEFFGNYIGKITKDYYITAPSVKRVSKPKVTGKKNKIIVKWKKVKGASGYTVYYSLNKNMKGEKSIHVKASKRKLTINKLKSNTRYFVRVAAYKTVGGRAFPGKQSKTKSAKTK